MGYVTWGMSHDGHGGVMTWNIGWTSAVGMYSEHGLCHMIGRDDTLATSHGQNVGVLTYNLRRGEALSGDGY